MLNFTSLQVSTLCASILLLLGSLFFFESKRKISLLLLTLGTLALGFFMAGLDPFLTLWDEQFHALVAKNFAASFFKPVLYSVPILDYDYQNWTANYIWVHNQPLFLWQMAISIKLFGINELSVRIPSIIMHSLMPLLIYRIGKLTVDAKTGYLGALFFAVAYYPLEMVAGKYASDHNDIAFLFYVTASLWSWFEYSASGKRKWLLLIGLFSGCAVLVKWLMGLLVYFIWFISKTIINKHEFFNVRSYIPIFASFAISLVVFIPWQIYIHSYFPKEAGYELAFNSRHIYESVEGQEGNIWFHFDKAFKSLYGSGDIVGVAIIIGLIFLIRNTKEWMHRVFIISSIIIVYVFYTIAATKMIAYTIIVSPFIYLGLGALVKNIQIYIEKRINIKPLVFVISLTITIVICSMLFNLTRIRHYHTNWKPLDNQNRTKELIEMSLIKRLPSLLPTNNYVLINSHITYAGHIPVMFYTDYIAYDFVPTPNQISIIKGKGYNVAALDLGDLPDYILKDTNILRIDRLDFKNR